VEVCVNLTIKVSLKALSHVISINAILVILKQGGPIQDVLPLKFQHLLSSAFVIDQISLYLNLSVWWLPPDTCILVTVLSLDATYFEISSDWIIIITTTFSSPPTLITVKSFDASLCII